MPLYLYKNPDSEEVKEVYQKINDEHSYEEEGVVWKRVFTPPQVASTLKIDPNSSRSFIEKTNCKGTIGDLWDRSKELSEKRKQERGDGKDPVFNKWKKKYSEERGGKEYKERVPLKDIKVNL